MNALYNNGRSILATICWIPFTSLWSEVVEIELYPELWEIFHWYYCYPNEKNKQEKEFKGREKRGWQRDFYFYLLALYGHVFIVLSIDEVHQ